MARKEGPSRSGGTDLGAGEIARDDAVDARYEDNPSPSGLYARGDIDRDDYEKISRLCAAGPPDRPFGGLIAALRAERERQGLSLAAVAERSGIGRAAIHKLEIGVNRNPTATTLIRYADALGKQLDWSLADRTDGKPLRPSAGHEPVGAGLNG